MIDKFAFNFADLGVEVSDVSDLLGYQNNVLPEPFPEIIEQAINTAKTFKNIQGGYKVYNNISVNKKDQILQIENQIFHPGKIVISQLLKAESIAIFICTAGNEIMEISKKISLENDPVLGYVFDTLGSVIVEKTLQSIQQKLKDQQAKDFLNISDSFSPGYCEWSVAEQVKLFSLVPDNFCNVSLSESFLMSPIKSVSGFIGIGRKLKQSGYQCNWCDDINCIYGKIRRKKKM